MDRLHLYKDAGALLLDFVDVLAEIPVKIQFQVIRRQRHVELQPMDGLNACAHLQGVQAMRCPPQAISAERK